MRTVNVSTWLKCDKIVPVSCRIYFKHLFLCKNLRVVVTMKENDSRQEYYQANSSVYQGSNL